MGMSFEAACLCALRKRGCGTDFRALSVDSMRFEVDDCGGDEIDEEGRAGAGEESMATRR